MQDSPSDGVGVVKDCVHFGHMVAKHEDMQLKDGPWKNF